MFRSLFMGGYDSAKYLLDLEHKDIFWRASAAQVHTYLHTYIHTHIHTYIRTYTHIFMHAHCDWSICKRIKVHLLSSMRSYPYLSQVFVCMYVLYVGGDYSGGDGVLSAGFN